VVGGGDDMSDDEAKLQAVLNVLDDHEIDSEFLRTRLNGIRVLYQKHKRGPSWARSNAAEVKRRGDIIKHAEALRRLIRQVDFCQDLPPEFRTPKDAYDTLAGLLTFVADSAKHKERGFDSMKQSHKQNRMKLPCYRPLPSHSPRRLLILHSCTLLDELIGPGVGADEKIITPFVRAVSAYAGGPPRIPQSTIKTERRRLGKTGGSKRKKK
jgi:hypothetical protein